MFALRFAIPLVLAASVAFAQRTDVNYDESKVPKYVLPDPLVLNNGKRVGDARTWTNTRRPEILELFRSNVFGRIPGRPQGMTFELAEINQQTLGGSAIRKQVVVYFSKQKDGPKMEILLYVPAGARKPVPVFLGLNFTGNHSANADPGIRLGDLWQREPVNKKQAKQRATDASRGAAASRWQIEKILERGYGVATIYYGDIEPDFDGGMPYGVRPLFAKPGETRAADAWAAIGAWAWGLSRAMDYLETDKNVDARRVVLMGHSRLGKTALWAGAEEPRFAIVISNDSGEGGAALARRRFGERVKNLNTSFPHWFADNYWKFNDREDDLPIDAHMLIALIAPRPVYVASAQEDQWADPKGEFLAASAAGGVYKLLGKQGLETDQMPAIHQPIMNTVGYHIRAGKHDVTAYDWDRFLDFADKHFGRPR
ncbi:MAG: acetylxylan esterase [Bryobacterales bacterium]|nr:acetylxylan esterase [Bryobacterales bacterium]